MIDGGFGGIKDIPVFMKKWTLLSREEPFPTKRKAQEFIDTHSKNYSHLTEHWTEATIVEQEGKFYIYYIL